jgi:hypothetical protein
MRTHSEKPIMKNTIKDTDEIDLIRTITESLNRFEVRDESKQADSLVQ